MKMKMETKSTENMTITEIFQEIAHRQITALMFHDSMYDLYSFLNLTGFKCLHKHQYLEESEEFLHTKEYFMETHNKLLNTWVIDQPKSIIPEEWYRSTRFDVTPQLLKQYVEISFNMYKSWEEETKIIYEDCAKSLMDMGRISDAEKVKCLIEDVTCELKIIYEIILNLNASGYDHIYILDMQPKLHKKYK